MLNSEHALLFASLLIVLAAIISWDLWGPRSSNLKNFDPAQVARLETQMWRAYYGKQPLRLYYGLAVVLRRSYRLPLLRSFVVAYHGARAAVVFQRGTNRREYERALPDLIDYYSAIRKVSETPFDIAHAAQLELEWWIVHREREKHASRDLPLAIAALAGELYQMPADRLIDHGRYRAEAMLLRDRFADAGSVSESDWRTIDELIQQSWFALWRVVNTEEA